MRERMMREKVRRQEFDAKKMHDREDNENSTLEERDAQKIKTSRIQCAKKTQKKTTKTNWLTKPNTFPWE